MPNDHHPCSPSALARRAACPGSMRMEGDVLDALGGWAPKTDMEDTPQSAEGTMLHLAVYDEETRKGLDTEQLSALEPVDEFLAQFKGVEKHHEVPLELTVGKLFDRKIISTGTADFVAILSPDEAVVADWKFGYVEVATPSDNCQLGCYSAMVMQRFGVSKVRAVSIQPRVFSQPQEFTFTNFDGLVASFVAIIEACKSPDAGLVNGKHCRYCNGRGVCPEFARMTSVLAYTADAITLDNMAYIYERSSIVLQRVIEIRDAIKLLLLDAGGEAPGIRLRPRRGKRIVSDTQACYESVQEVFTVEEFMEFVCVRISELEKEFGRRAKAAGLSPSIKAAVEAFRKMPYIQDSPAVNLVMLDK